MARATRKRSGADSEAGEAAPEGKRARGGPLRTVQQMEEDPITELARKYWPKGKEVAADAADEALVRKIYEENLGSGAPDRERIAVLEFSGYLERYLWPRFDPARSSRAHLVSIILMVNEKFRQNVAAWSFLDSNAPGGAGPAAGPAFADFFDRVLDLGRGLGGGSVLGDGQSAAAPESESGPLSLKERGSFILFLVHCFQSLEQDAVRPCVLRLVALPLWASLSTSRLRLELEEHPQLERRWDPAMARAGLESALRAARTALGAADAVAATKAAQTKVSRARQTVDAVKQWVQEEGPGGELAADDVQAKHGEVEAAAQAAAKVAEQEAKKEEKKKKRAKALAATGATPAQLASRAAAAAEWAAAARRPLERPSPPAHGGTRPMVFPERDFVPALIDDFFQVLSHVHAPEVGGSGAAAAAVAAPSASAPSAMEEEEEEVEVAPDAGGAEEAEEEEGKGEALASRSQGARDAPASAGAGDGEQGAAHGDSSELSGAEPASLWYLERFMELLVDLLSQLPTRRFFRALFTDLHVLARCRCSPLMEQGRGAGRLFAQLVDTLQFYERFEINDHTGEPKTREEAEAEHASRLSALQRIAFKYFREDGEAMALDTLQHLGTRERLVQHLERLSSRRLHELAARLFLVSPPLEEGGGEKAMSRPLLMEVLVQHLVRRCSQLDEANAVPLLPDEALLWDPHQVPAGAYHGDRVLALPKLNLQFLTLHDYLLRSFTLFRLEAAYEVREDVVDAVKRMRPCRDAFAPAGQDSTLFAGWARMATRVKQFQVRHVAAPRVGESVPAQVTAEAVIDLSHYHGTYRAEWEDLGLHDVVFLVTVRAPVALGSNADQNAGIDPAARREEDETFPARYGVERVRGGEVVDVLDESGKSLADAQHPAGTERTLRLRVDPAQYQRDADALVCGEQEDPYPTLNLVIRRKGKENNFKAVLETIRALMNDAAVGKAVPSWLHDVFLGYGDPAAATFRSLPSQLRTIDFRDTFTSAGHLRASFPNAEVVFEHEDGTAAGDDASPPFRLTFRTAAAATKRIQRQGAAGGAASKEGAGELVVATPYRRPNPGPFPQDQPLQNTVPFTPAQVEAIRSGINPGLTMVVGPPGTGKTDVAVQTVATLYRNFPEQRILLVAHSNQALNDLFAKIMERDVDPRHLLRLGAGERELDTAQDFGRDGRVDYTLGRRMQLLEEVKRLAESLGVSGDGPSATCEAAHHFQLQHMQAAIERYRLALRDDGAADAVKKHFPFSTFFSTAPGWPLLHGEDRAADEEVAEGCFRHLHAVFEELADYRAFELLRTPGKRGDYLLTRQARIVAMTCTHAALTRKRLVDLGFRYDTMVMEEAAQVIEVETLIPMLLQHHDEAAGARLKRVVMIGDHNQLPPVVQNAAFEKYGHLDQSLFARFVRLGVPYVQLDRQGRARPELADLFKWRYRTLGDLPHVYRDGGEAQYRLANTGMRFPFQLVNVDDYQGRGETQPKPHFFQNLGEAEYLVATFQFLRLCGVPAHRITMLTTYNGQKHLLRDVVKARCAAYPIFGEPAHISTVDRFQGQQNDIVLLSLVRTRSVGHVRDVRRLIVAMSRAKLGLYVFCRQRLFSSCIELAPVFNRLAERPSKLTIVPEEAHPTQRAVDEDAEGFEVEDVAHMGLIVQQMGQRRLDEQRAQQEAAARPSKEGDRGVEQGHEGGNGVGAETEAATGDES